ncbi:MAG: cation-translocating P-type ATPase [Bryobacteraceae bacterium]
MTKQTGTSEAKQIILWHTLDQATTFEKLITSAAGLDADQAGARLAEYGLNELAGGSAKSPWRILWEQLSALMVVILMIAGALSALLGDYKDAIAIGTIVILNAALGFSQEYRAEKAMAALKKLAVPSARVRRGGEVQDVPAYQLVPGDVVLLEAGNFVPADCRVLESADLQAQEAALTGESVPIHKTTETFSDANLPLGDRKNMAFLGTFITAGRGQVVVVETGMRTELGRIATMIQHVDREPTPLQRRLTQLGKGLAAAALFLVAVIFAIGWIRGEELRLLFLTAVSIAVAAVPEGLPAVVTIALTLGAHRMLGKSALIRKLPAVETLGSVTVICSDKTGTLTQNRMTASVLCNAEGELDLRTNSDGSREKQIAFDVLLSGGALCNDAIVQMESVSASQSNPLGDPTEIALVTVAGRFGLIKPTLDALMPREHELPFSAERKRMTTVHRVSTNCEGLPTGLTQICRLTGASHLSVTKGAPDGLLALSEYIWINGAIEALTEDRRAAMHAANASLAKKGMRVLGVAFRALASNGAELGLTLETDLIFAGIIGILDPPRTEAASAVAMCKSAGIRPVMITGDHPLTAQQIARELGIDDTGRALTGVELDKLTPLELESNAEETAIYARVSPEHKLKIVDALQRRGHVVAMTGDGVNDAPALKKSDIGVAMGITGTDVAKEAADMVLLDDNFATIVSAVEEGRVIYDNIRKFIRYILATNSGEIWVMLVAPMLGMPLPLLPLQILWMNLVTDGLPALALGLEPSEADTMRRPPHHPNESIFGRGLGLHVLWVGLLMGCLSLGAGYWFWRMGDPNWQTVLFTTLTLSQMTHVMAIRSERHSLFTIGIFSNKPLVGAVALTALLQLALMYAPSLQEVFKTTALPLSLFAIAATLSSFVFVAVELEKWMGRKRERTNSH